MQRFFVFVGEGLGVGVGVDDVGELVGVGVPVVVGSVSVDDGLGLAPP